MFYELFFLFYSRVNKYLCKKMIDMTNRLLFTFALFITSLSCTVAKEKSVVTLADPFILLDGDTYYAYGTGDADGIAVWTSKNLKKGLLMI